MENQEGQQRTIKRYLLHQGCEVESVVGLHPGVRRMNQYTYDIALVQEPFEKGGVLNLAHWLRQQDGQAGLILLMESNLPEPRIQALEAGYDDVLSAPYHLGECYARMRAVVRRRTNQYKRELQLGELLILPDERRAFAAGLALPLTRKEFALLFFLARNRNRIVTKEMIGEYLWGDDMEDAASFDFLYAHLKNLRKKLRQAGQEHLIETVYGVGYIIRG